jgi:pimeloyl-ACP methyl ester carboxylesterase
VEPTDHPTDPGVFDHPRFVTSPDGTPIATYDLGGPGRDLLLVHATGFCAGVWGPLAGRLADQRVAALDVRGHGRSGSPAVMDWEATGQDVLAAVDGLGLDQPVGVGHSMGGASLLMAEIQRPGTFAALWVFEPIVFPTDFPAPAPGTPNPMVEAARRRREAFPSAELALANFAGKRPLDELAPECLEAYIRFGFEHHADGSISLRCRPEFEASTYAAGSTHRTWGRLGEVACPVTVVRGRPDPGPALLAPGIADRLPAGTLEEHPGFGHFAPLAALDDMAASVLRLAANAH